MTVAATTTAVKTAMDCKDDGVVGDYNSDSGVGNSDDDNGNSGDSKGGGNIPQSPKAPAEELAAGSGGCNGYEDNNQLKAETAAAAIVKVAHTYKNHSKRQWKKRLQRQW